MEGLMRRKNIFLVILLLFFSILTGCGSEADRWMAEPSVIMQPETVPSVAGQPETELADTKQSETEQPDTVQSDAEQSETGQSDTKQPETEQSGTQPNTDQSGTKQPETAAPTPETDVREDGEYTSKEDVAAYLHLFGHLPVNFITKEEARKLGWVSAEGNLSEVAPGKSIGGDYFGNYEGLLPEKEGREYHECDIDSDGGYRGAKRIVYSNDGLIYYTEDHYETFELLYGEE